MSVLHIWFLNVDHGDSIVIEYISNTGKKAFGVIDSNIPAGMDEPPALRKLKELGAEELSFVALTHPHADHFKGLSQILKTYKVHEFYSFPLEHHVAGNLKKLATQYRKLAANTNDPEQEKVSEEFIEILAHCKANIKDWHTPLSWETPLYPQGFNSCEIFSICPVASDKSFLFELLESENYSVISSPLPNDLSMAFRIIFNGKIIVLGGDVTREKWIAHRRKWGRFGDEDSLTRTLAAQVAKLPHHGSKKDCEDFILDYLFESEGERFAIVSASGSKHHPASSVLTYLGEKKIQPYCTNLSKLCGANAATLLTLPDLDQKLSRLLQSVANDITKKQICQGDILLEVNASGDLNIIPQHKHPCQFRGDYDRIFG